jgi:hypothetical protein
MQVVFSTQRMKHKINNMKKIWILAFLLIFSVSIFGQIPLINIGTGPNMHNGDPARTWAIKDNACITQVNLNTTAIGLLQPLLVAGTNIKTINGVSPLGGGNMVIGSGGTMVYPAGGIVVSTGAAWATSIANNSANWNTA